MDSSVYVGGARMSGLLDSLDMIAGNLANSHTPGYKRHLGCFEALVQQHVEGIPAPGQPAGARVHWPQLAGWRIDFSQGPLRATGRALDVAIRDTHRPDDQPAGSNTKAFFEVETPSGQRRYTRKGRIHMNARGELMDEGGNLYASQGGGALRLPPQSENLEITIEGEIQADGQAVGRLRLAQVDTRRLVARGHGLFSLPPGADRPERARDFEVLQRFIEGSNSNPIESLVALVQVNRSYEASARILKRMDQVSGQLVRAAV